MLAGTDLTADLASIRCPTLVVAGAYDQLRPPAHVREIASRIPGARFEIIESGHYIPVQTPEIAVAMLSEFLQRADIWGEHHA